MEVFPSKGLVSRSSRVVGKQDQRSLVKKRCEIDANPTMWNGSGHDPRHVSGFHITDKGCVRNIIQGTCNDKIAHLMSGSLDIREPILHFKTFRLFGLDCAVFWKQIQRVQTLIRVTIRAPLTVTSQLDTCSGLNIVNSSFPPQSLLECVRPARKLLKNWYQTIKALSKDSYFSTLI